MNSSFMATWMGLKAIMLSEINLRKNTAWFHLYMEYQKQTEVDV